METALFAFLRPRFGILGRGCRTNAGILEGVQTMNEPAIKTEQLDTTDPPVLVAILIAAHRTGDRLLEAVVRRELAQRHRIKVRFARDKEATQ